MAKRDASRITSELITLQPTDQITVLPPSSGIVGSFLDQTANMFKARAMRMNGLLRRIDEAGQRTESLLRTAAESMEAAEGQLKKDMLKEGLLSDTENHIADQYE